MSYTWFIDKNGEKNKSRKKKKDRHTDRQQFQYRRKDKTTWGQRKQKPDIGKDRKCFSAINYKSISSKAALFIWTAVYLLIAHEALKSFLLLFSTPFTY